MGGYEVPAQAQHATLEKADVVRRLPPAVLPVKSWLRRDHNENPIYRHLGFGIEVRISADMDPTASAPLPAM